MESTWFVEAAPREQCLDLAGVSLLMEAHRRPAPAQALLEVVNHVAPVEFISLVAYDDGGPRLLEGHAHSPGVRNVTGECWALYRQRFFSLDAATRLASRMPHGLSRMAVAALRCDAEHIPDQEWRRSIYDRERLTDRLTFLYALPDRKAYAINLYRNEAMGRFMPGEIDQLLGLSPLLRQAHQAALGTGREARDIDARVAAAHARLALHAPQLSSREAEVCARVACGMSADGIAEALDVAPSTVVTLRKRAYAKLGLHSRIDLVRIAG